ncbi:crotonase/enoyl-CoA hydratase family protein [Marinicella sp. S1101]|uniref:crotonase/enoyl-CoA hydratase family protein n=1 Tax=Marinicella marina TaxID=2996016 RepID=UPI002260A7F5|nr:crotonase/enoyl-CoA hydratase family protein [Marinicella marina]MCX7554023.1 crotonase/enoyl-CoA hydratase family protein [Marinicella marina]MDJ1140515.1 crotonase/enoyl-CoA hydratase family protein [Marinicella marina]
MNSSQRIKTTLKNQVAYVSLNRPNKMNALDFAMFKAINQTIKQLRKDRSIRAVIVTGEGDNFCSGLDVKSMMKTTSGPLKLLLKLNPWRSNLAQKVSTEWQRIPVPVITVIQGRCWGGGLHIALGADIRIAHPEASLSIMEGRWGLIPDMGGLLALRQHCRIDVAKELTWTSELLSAKKAQQAGLITHVTDDPMAMAQSMVTELLQQSPDALAGVKNLYNKSWRGGKGTALMRETWYQLRTIFGKNSKIKAYNQTHEADKQKSFQPRKRW